MPSGFVAPMYIWNTHEEPRRDYWPSLLIFITISTGPIWNSDHPLPKTRVISLLHSNTLIECGKIKPVTSSQLEKSCRTDAEGIYWVDIHSHSGWTKKPHRHKTLLAVCVSPCLRDISLVGVPLQGLPQLDHRLGLLQASPFGGARRCIHPSRCHGNMPV